MLLPYIAAILRDPAFPEGLSWHRQEFLPGELVVKEGSVDRRLYLVESGCLRVSGTVELEDQRRIQPGICDLGPGDLFGELVLFEPHPRSASVIAVTTGSLISIDCDHLSAYLERHPEIGFQVLKQLFNTLIARLTKANQRVEHLFAWGLKAHGIDKYL